MKDDREILNFLSIADVELKIQPYHILSQMRATVAEEDYMKLHNLGYVVQKKNYAFIIQTERG